MAAPASVAVSDGIKLVKYFIGCCRYKWHDIRVRSDFQWEDIYSPRQRQAARSDETGCLRFIPTYRTGKLSSRCCVPSHPRDVTSSLSLITVLIKYDFEMVFTAHGKHAVRA